MMKPCMSCRHRGTDVDTGEEICLQYDSPHFLGFVDAYMACEYYAPSQGCD
jgi:hypothetical protein